MQLSSAALAPSFTSGLLLEPIAKQENCSRQGEKMKRLAVFLSVLIAACGCGGGGSKRPLRDSQRDGFSIDCDPAARRNTTVHSRHLGFVQHKCHLERIRHRRRELHGWYD